MKRLRALRELQKELGAEVYLVGGTVRDLVRRKEPNDLDVLVRGIAPADFEVFMRDRGTLELVGASFGVYIFKPKRLKGHIEIAFPRTEVSTGPKHDDFEVVTNSMLSIEEDSLRRDFTLNAMYLNLSDVEENGKFDKKKVIDFHNGLEHIKKRLIVAVGTPEERIEEDPLRMMRAMVLVARTGYRLEGNTFGAIKRNAEKVRTVSAERIRDEFIKIMKSEKPSRGFKTMDRTDLLAVLFPELHACVGCGQNPKYHSYPVFEHVIKAADAACGLTEDLAVRFAALCHDLGKAPTRALRPNGDGPDDVSFHNHEIVSCKLTYAFMRRLKFPKKFTEDVIALVRMHQYKYDRDWTDKAVRRFIRNIGLTRSDLEDLEHHPQFIVRMADRMGNSLKADLPVTIKQRDFQRRIIEVYENSSAHSLRDLKVNGRDIMERFDIPAGPSVGKIVAYLFEVCEEDPKSNNRDDLFRLAGEFLKENNSGSTNTDRSRSNLSEGTAE